MDNVQTKHLEIWNNLNLGFSFCRLATIASNSSAYTKYLKSIIIKLEFSKYYSISNPINSTELNEYNFVSELIKKIKCKLK